MSKTAPPTRRRWFRFGLRSLLVFTALVGLLMSWIVKERRQSAREMEIAQQLEKEGWKVTVGRQHQRRHDLWNRMSSATFGGRIERLAVKGRVADFSPLETFTNLQIYIHSQQPFGNLTTPEFAELRRSLELKFPPRQLTLLSQLTHLRVLEIESTDISNKDIERLKVELPDCHILQSENGTWSSAP